MYKSHTECDQKEWKTCERKVTNCQESVKNPSRTYQEFRHESVMNLSNRKESVKNLSNRKESVRHLSRICLKSVKNPSKIGFQTTDEEKDGTRDQDVIPAQRMNCKNPLIFTS